MNPVSWLIGFLVSFAGEQLGKHFLTSKVAKIFVNFGSAIAGAVVTNVVNQATSKHDVLWYKTKKSRE